jgi:hypothetical protein
MSAGRPPIRCAILAVLPEAPTGASPRLAGNTAIELYRSAGFDQSEYVPTSVQGKPPPGVRIFAFEKALP